MKNNKCKVCGGNDASVAYNNDIIVVSKCRVCDFYFLNDTGKKVEYNSSGKKSNVTAKGYIEHLLHLDNEKKEKYSVLAKNRYAYYSKKLQKEKISILEIGCGVAHQSVTFKSLGGEYMGIDINSDVIQESKKYNYNTKCIDFFDFDSEGMQYDVILCSQVLEHITEPREFIEKVYKSLKKNGIFHIDVPNNDSLSSLINEIMPNNKNRYRAIINPHHAFAYNKTSLEFLLSQYFKDISVFNSSSTSKLYGQTLKLNLFQKTFFIISSIINKGNILVGIAQK